MKIHTVNLKTAIAKCYQKDAPELNLPPFNSPYRFINTLMTSADSMEHSQLMDLFKMYKMMQTMRGHDSSSYMPSMFNDQHYGAKPYSMDHTNKSWMEKMMMKMAMKKMFEKTMMYKMQQMQRSNEESSYNPFNKNTYRERMAALLQRHKRQAPKKPENAAVTLPENLDLGDRLADKLKQEQIEMEQKIGNMTCVMREIGVLNQQNELDFAAQKRAFEKFNIPNQWLKNRLLNDMELCNKVADSLPSESQKEYNFPGLINMSQVNSYLNCCKYSKMRTCMYKDVKETLEKNFGSLDKIMEQTQLNEDQLFPLVTQLLHGEEMDYFGF